MKTLIGRWLLASLGVTMLAEAREPGLRVEVLVYVGCLLATGWTAGGPLHGETLEDAPRFTVRLYNYAKVDGLELGRAVQAASNVFHRAGIELVWVDCPVSRGEGERNSACGQFDGRPWVQLKILPREMAQRLQLGHEVFGVAIGSNAYVYLHRVQELSSQRGLPESLILGHVMAHELGHVLLGPGNHTPTGVMIADLKRGDLPIILQGGLVFSPDQAARMQARLRLPG